MMRWDSFVYNGTIVLVANGPLSTDRFCELIADESEGQVHKWEAKSMLEAYWCRDYFNLVFMPGPRWTLRLDYNEELLAELNGLVSAIEETL
jgi:hypothetical protein